MAKSPELIIYTGPMFGGKTTKLLAALERYQYQNKRTALFKPNLDTRYSKDRVVTHRGQQHKSVVVRTGEDIVRNATTADVVAVDEMFMIPGSATALLQLFSSGKTVSHVRSLSVVIEKSTVVLPKPAKNVKITVLPKGEETRQFGTEDGDSTDYTEDMYDLRKATGRGRYLSDTAEYHNK